MNLNYFVCETKSLYSITTLTPDVEFLMQKAMVMLAVILNTEENAFNQFGKIGKRGMWRKEVGMATRKVTRLILFFFLLLGVKMYTYIFISFLKLSSHYSKTAVLTCISNK